MCADVFSKLARNVLVLVHLYLGHPSSIEHRGPTKAAQIANVAIPKVGDFNEECGKLWPTNSSYKAYASLHALRVHVHTLSYKLPTELSPFCSFLSHVANSDVSAVDFVTSVMDV